MVLPLSRSSWRTNSIRHRLHSAVAGCTIQAVSLTIRPALCRRVTLTMRNSGLLRTGLARKASCPHQRQRLYRTGGDGGGATASLGHTRTQTVSLMDLRPNLCPARCRVCIELWRAPAFLSIRSGGGGTSVADHTVNAQAASASRHRFGIRRPSAAPLDQRA